MIGGSILIFFLFFYGAFYVKELFKKFNIMGLKYYLWLQIFCRSRFFSAKFLLNDQCLIKNMEEVMLI